MKNNFNELDKKNYKQLKINKLFHLQMKKIRYTYNIEDQLLLLDLRFCLKKNNKFFQFFYI